VSFQAQAIRRCGGTELRAQILERAVDEPGAGVADDEGGYGAYLQKAGDLAVGFHRLGGSRVGHGAGEGGRIKPDVAGGVGKHLPVGDIARFSQMGELDAVEQVPVRRLPAKSFGCLAGKRRLEAVRIVEAGNPHGFHVDQAGPVADLPANRPVAEDGLAGLSGRAPTLSHLLAACLQHEAAMADVEVELVRQAAHARGDVEAPAADHIVEEVDCECGHHAASLARSAPTSRAAMRATCAPWKRAPARSVAVGCNDPSAPAMVPAP
jgi:hypothetical protein